MCCDQLTPFSRACSWSFVTATLVVVNCVVSGSTFIYVSFLGLNMFLLNTKHISKQCMTYKLQSDNLDLGLLTHRHCYYCCWSSLLLLLSAFCSKRLSNHLPFVRKDNRIICLFVRKYDRIICLLFKKTIESSTFYSKR